MPITIAIAEDNSHALKDCVNKLGLYPEFHICHKAFNGKELLEQLAQVSVELILMDIQMPGMDGIECTKIVKTTYPHIKVLMLTTFDNDESIFQAIMAGASGYLLKEESAETLHDAIIDTIGGGAAMSPGIALKVLNLIRQQPQKPTIISEDFGLTKREIELLEQLKNGFSYEKIASNLFISYGTVRKHIENIYRKLQVNNKVEALKKISDHSI